MPPGKHRDPHYMNVKNGGMLSLHSRAKKQVAEDDKNFNPATMGNRIFKTLPRKAKNGFASDAIQRAAGRKLKSKKFGYGRASGYGVGKGVR